jgi:hypothetical protein
VRSEATLNRCSHGGAGCRRGAGRFELKPALGTGYVGFLDPSGGPRIRSPWALATVTVGSAQCWTWSARPNLPSPRRPSARSMPPTSNATEATWCSVTRMGRSGPASDSASMERRTGRADRDAVDHRRGARDDVTNAAAGALVMALRTVSVKAPLPSTFVQCINPTSMERCPLCYLRGASWPSDPALPQALLRTQGGVAAVSGTAATSSGGRTGSPQRGGIF